jgi:signal recognition particle receptor subunit beta
VVYVIDSADKERLDVARQELELMLQEEELRGAPVLILANKQDLPNAMTEQEVSADINDTQPQKRKRVFYWHKFMTHC